MMAGDDIVIGLEEGWNEIEETGVKPYIARIEQGLDPKEFERCAIKAETYMQVYDKVFKMCIQREPHNHSEELYKRYCDSIAAYLQNSVAPALARARTQNLVSFLREWTLRWKYQKLLIKGLASMFTYLDRFFVPNSEDRLSLSEMGFSIFRQTLYDPFRESIRDALLYAVAKERASEEQDPELLREAVHVFVELGYKLDGVELQLYIADVETPLVRESEQFYREHSRAWLDVDTCPAYLIKAEAALRDEEMRLDAYLHPSTHDKQMDACREELLRKHRDELMGKPTGVDAMLTCVAYEDLTRMYSLLSPVPEGTTSLAKAFRDHVRKLGCLYVEESQQDRSGEVNKGLTPKKGKGSGSDENDLIRRLIDLHTKYGDVVRRCFSSDQQLEKALRTAFEDSINRDYHTSNLLAKFVNNVLSRGSRESHQTLDPLLDNVVTLYGYIRDKDIFEEEYQTYLATRLLQGKSESHQAEKSMIAKLKRECGYHWTSKLESMFKDVQLSEEMMIAFTQDTNLGPQDMDPELKVHICTMGRWPSAALPPCNMPQALVKITDRFRLFYVHRHSGKCLEWQMDKGEADVSVRYGNGRPSKVFVVTTLQMVVLLLFNGADSLSYSQILERSGVPAETLEVHLMSLAHPRSKILLKKPNTRKLASDDSFSFNLKYTNEYYRVKVPMMKSTVAVEAKGLDPKIQTQRRHQIDAAVVRIMKTRQRLEHNQLLAEVIKQLQRFKPDANDIKKRIEHLIEQEYLERDEKDRRVYNYLA